MLTIHHLTLTAITDVLDKSERYSDILSAYRRMSTILKTLQR